MVTGGLARLACRNKSLRWSPYTSDGQTSLTEALSALKTYTNDTTISSDNAHLTPSPVENRRSLRDRPAKRLPIAEHESSRYANNPWAQMLASSMRNCQASRIRFPVALLTDFYIASESEAQYLVPSDLADLAKFKADLTSDDAVNTIINRTYGEYAGRTARVLPYDFLLETLTNKFRPWDSKAQRSETKLGEVANRIVPKRWSMAAQKMRDYRSASKEYFEEVRIRREAGEDLKDTEEREPVDLKSLQWKPDIVARMSNAMSMRILIALQEVMQSAMEGQIITVDVPSTPKLYTNGNNTLSSETPREFWNDMGDIEAATAITGSPTSTRNHQGNNDDARPPIAVGPDEIAETPPDSLRGSIVLYTGSPSDFQATLTAWHNQQTTTAPLKPYTPPMLTVSDTIRLPIFNLQSLLPLGLHRELGILQPSSSLILIKQTTPQAAILTHEIWQLFRFLGSKLGTNPEQAPVVGEQPRKAKDNDARMREREAPISDAQRKHLWQILGWKEAE